VTKFLTRLAISSAALMLASACGCVAVVFLIVAFYMGMANLMPDWLAALATAGAAILFAILVIVIARMATRRERAPASARARMGAAAEMGEFLGLKLRDFGTHNTSTTLIALLVAGFAMGVSPKLRKFLLKLL
jgi:putative superfamily III holin-X